MGVCSINEEDLKKNLEFFKVPNASMESIRSKLAMKIFDEYENIQKGMYSISVYNYIDDSPKQIALTPLSNHHHSIRIIRLRIGFTHKVE